MSQLDNVGAHPREPAAGLVVTTQRLWLAIKRSDGRAHTLYTRVCQSAHTLRAGDNVELWPETDDLASPFWPVKKVWMGADDMWNVSLANMIINPDSGMRGIIRNSLDQMQPYYDNGEATHPWEPLAAGRWTEWTS